MRGPRKRCRASGPALFPKTREFARRACKPDSVQGLPLWMTIPLAPPLPAGSSCQPGSLGPKLPYGGIPDRDPGPAPRETPIRHCSRWGLPCRPCYQRRGGLLPHRFTLTLPWKGGLFSVALSLGLPPPGVTRHRYFRESGLSSNRRRPAVIQPSAPLPPRRARRQRQPGSGGRGLRPTCGRPHPQVQWPTDEI